MSGTDDLVDMALEQIMRERPYRTFGPAHVRRAIEEIYGELGIGSPTITDQEIIGTVNARGDVHSVALGGAPIWRFGPEPPPPVSREIGH